MPGDVEVRHYGFELRPSQTPQFARVTIDTGGGMKDVLRILDVWRNLSSEQKSSAIREVSRLGLLQEYQESADAGPNPLSEPSPETDRHRLQSADQE